MGDSVKSSDMKKAKNKWKKSAPPMSEDDAVDILESSMRWLRRHVEGDLKQSRELGEMLRDKGIWYMFVDDLDEQRPIFKTKHGKFRRMDWPKGFIYK